MKNSAIEWTAHTFNPWWGCIKLPESKSAGTGSACDHCYAAALANWRGHRVWGEEAPRRQFGDVHWRAPLAWNAKAAEGGRRERVFCASMGDVFEDRRDLDEGRARLWRLIEATPNLDWLLLSKRPQNAAKLAPMAWRAGWPPNAWAGATVEAQWAARARIPHLLRTLARVRFLSCEPLLGPLDLSPWLDHGIHWVIAGGESGAAARPSDPAWFRTLRDRCGDARVPFFFKQWGVWGETGVRSSKKANGRLLDGRTWDEIPD